jgi:hypothetical protein
MDIDRELRNQGLLPIAEAVERLSISLRTLRRWVASGEVASRLALGRRWVDERSILARAGLLEPGAGDVAVPQNVTDCAKES